MRTLIKQAKKKAKTHPKQKDLKAIGMLDGKPWREYYAVWSRQIHFRESWLSEN